MTMKDDELNRLFNIPVGKREKTDESKHSRFKFLPVDHPANWIQKTGIYPPGTLGAKMQSNYRRKVENVTSDPELIEESMHLANTSTEDLSVEEVVERAKTLRDIASKPF